MTYFNEFDDIEFNDGHNWDFEAVRRHIRYTLEAFHPVGSTFELRALDVRGRGRPHTWSSVYHNHEKAALDAANLDASVELVPAGVYFTLNPVNPELRARSDNNLEPWPEATTADCDVQRRSKLLIDIDPNRARGIPSSDEELRASQIVGSQIKQWLVQQAGFTSPFEAMSGNGHHLVFPIDLDNSEESTATVREILHAVAKYFGGENTPSGLPKVTVDTSVFNASRITKLYGTMARKGGGIPDRPHRRSRLLRVPEDVWNRLGGGHVG